MKNNSLEEIVYSTRTNPRDNVPISFDDKAFAPECGSVFSAKVYNVEGKKDYIIDRIINYTGYIKTNSERPNFKIVPGGFYRFRVVSSPYTKNHHNYFYAIPIRDLGKNESRNMNLIDTQTNIFLTRLGEFMLGLRFDRKTKKLGKLKKSQQGWDWFLKNFDVNI